MCPCSHCVECQRDCDQSCYKTSLNHSLGLIPCRDSSNHNGLTASKEETEAQIDGEECSKAAHQEERAKSNAKSCPINSWSVQHILPDIIVALNYPNKSCSEAKLKGKDCIYSADEAHLFTRVWVIDIVIPLPLMRVLNRLLIHFLWSLFKRSLLLSPRVFLNLIAIVIVINQWLFLIVWVLIVLIIVLIWIWWRATCHTISI